MGKFETPETEAAFDYIKKELIPKIDESKNCSMLESVGLSKSDIPKVAMFNFVTMAVLQPNYSATINFILENSSSFTEFIAKFDYYNRVFSGVRNRLDDVNIMELLKQLK